MNIIESNECLNINNLGPKTNSLHPQSFFSCLATDVCKDVSFSGCPIKNAHKIKKGIQADPISCQAACAHKEDCKYFRFTENFIHKCSFLEEDYRHDCNIFAAPMVSIFERQIPKYSNCIRKLHLLSYFLRTRV